MEVFLCMWFSPVTGVVFYKVTDVVLHSIINMASCSVAQVQYTQHIWW